MEVIAGVILSNFVAFVVQIGAVGVALHGEVAAEATGHPRGVAGVAGHAFAGVGQAAIG